MSIGAPTGFTPLNTPIECDGNFISINIGCGWKGTIGETLRNNFSSDTNSWLSLAGRDTIQYLCPQCNGIVYEEILKIS